MLKWDLKKDCPITVHVIIFCSFGEYLFDLSVSMILCWVKTWARHLSGLLFSKKLIICDHPTGCPAKQKKKMLRIKKKQLGSQSDLCCVSNPIPLFHLSLHYSNHGDQGSAQEKACLPVLMHPECIRVFRVLTYTQPPADFSKSMLAFLKILE